MSDKIRVLIVDDQAAMRQALVNALYFEDNITVVGTAQDGQEAITKTEELRPDVILMDIEMPRMDGLEATRQIKQKRPTIKIIVVSSENRYKNVAIEAGASSFLLKPVETAELIDNIVKTSRPD